MVVDDARWNSQQTLACMFYIAMGVFLLASCTIIHEQGYFHVRSGVGCDWGAGRHLDLCALRLDDWAGISEVLVGSARGVFFALPDFESLSQ